MSDPIVITEQPLFGTVYGDSVHCPRCGVPFLNRWNPNAEADVLVHTGMSLESRDGRGPLALCGQCIGALATAIGWINPEAGKARSSDVRRSQRRDEAVRAAQDARDSARIAAEGLAAALDNLDEVLG